MPIVKDYSSFENADELYAHIVRRLSEKQSANLEQAALRLTQIDYDPARAAIVSGLVQLSLRNFSQAAKIFDQCIKDFGETGAALTNLAKAYSGLGGREEMVLTMLRRSLRVDPNQSAGLMWYVKLNELQDGEAAILNSLHEIASEPGSWRALLWLARDDLKKGLKSDALTLYRRSLSMGFDSDALLMISGDLGANKMPNEVLELVEPRYDPQKHDINVGINLLQGFLDARRPADGLGLLNSIRANLAPSDHSLLNWHETEFARLG